MPLQLPIARLLLFILCCWLSPLGLRADNTLALQRLHAPWGQLLRQHVTPDGRLDYSRLQDDEDILLGYLQELRTVKPTAEAWTANETKAFWLNVYNAAATYLVLQYYPVTSINDIRVKTLGGAKSPWEAPVVTVGGQTYSLNQIERQMLRDQFHDPRIHFALMYGAASGAPLQAASYEAAQLDEQLDKQVRRFLNDPAYNQLAPEQVRLSGLFEAYAAEFGTEAQLIAFLNRYARTPILPTARVEFLSFSWALNDRPVLDASQAVGKQ